jgi:hypothetical protein
MISQHIALAMTFYNGGSSFDTGREKGVGRNGTVDTWFMASKVVKHMKCKSISTLPPSHFACPLSSGLASNVPRYAPKLLMLNCRSFSTLRDALLRC